MRAKRHIFHTLRIAFAALLLGAAPLHAQEISPEQLDLARKYVELTDRAQVYEISVVQTGIDTYQTLLAQNPELSTELDEVVGNTVQAYRGRKNELIDQFARVYAQRFTTDELTEIVAFYESDLGQKLSQQNFEANQQLTAIVGIFRQNLNIEFLAQVRAAMKEKGFDV